MTRLKDFIEECYEITECEQEIAYMIGEELIEDENDRLLFEEFFAKILTNLRKKSVSASERQHKGCNKTCKGLPKAEKDHCQTQCQSDNLKRKIDILKEIEIEDCEKKELRISPEECKRVAEKAVAKLVHELSKLDLRLLHLKRVLNKQDIAFERV